MKKILLLIGLVVLVSGSVFGKNINYFENSTWLCIEESSLGFNWNSQTSEWNKVTNFKLQKKIFKTTKNKCNEDKENSNQFCATLYDFGTEPFAYSYFDFWDYSSWGKDDSFIEGGYFDIFKLSDTGKFIYSSGVPGDVMDFTLNEKNTKQPMIISVGKCSKI
jgi:hypothetical protein|tara:strand:- start:895 stop:1383 length:489 start_codon:yes stop_codon:yes gene_type:complete